MPIIKYRNKSRIISNLVSVPANLFALKGIANYAYKNPEAEISLLILNMIKL